MKILLYKLMLTGAGYAMILNIRRMEVNARYTDDLFSPALLKQLLSVSMMQPPETVKDFYLVQDFLWMNIPLAANLRFMFFSFCFRQNNGDIS